MSPKGTLEETRASSGPASPTQAPQRGPEQSYHVAWEAAGGLWAKRPPAVGVRVQRDPEPWDSRGGVHPCPPQCPSSLIRSPPERSAAHVSTSTSHDGVLTTAQEVHLPSSCSVRKVSTHEHMTGNPLVLHKTHIHVYSQTHTGTLTDKVFFKL